MASKTKNKIPFWLTTLPKWIKELIVMKGYSFYEHPSVQSLSPLAYKVYDFMCKECGGKREFKFPYSVYKNFASKQGFLNAKNELIEKGFIEIAQSNANLRKPNLYRFTDTWKNL